MSICAKSTFHVAGPLEDVGEGSSGSPFVIQQCWCIHGSGGDWAVHVVHLLFIYDSGMWLVTGMWPLNWPCTEGRREAWVSLLPKPGKTPL